MAEQAISEPLLVFFQVVPFLFSILLRIFSPRFDTEWKTELGKYERALDHNLARDTHEWKYKKFTIYFYDKISLESGLRLSLFYASVLHLIAIYRSLEWSLAVPMIVLFALGYFLPGISDRFFQMGRYERNPDRYYNYYYVGDNPSRITKLVFENRFLSSWSQLLTPRVTTILIEAALLVAIVLLQFLPKSTAVYTSTLLVGVVIFLGALLFPMRRG